ncbi:MAG: hypothetical protein I3273_06680 [Candidatus Moeniiplasma glomeromycotorum]|nr:hypothetical protein [Candidatus Moeniiplasma glomeromycotorum]MCE8169770.1 hypothetical protein [Candidatus Moeniiplasma glomeromycotorum]
MTNYRTYTITNIDNRSSYISFSLNDKVNYRDGDYSYIDCENTYPWSSCQRCDQLEIDLDETRRWDIIHTFDKTSEVRKTTLALIPGASSSALTSRTTRLDVSEIRNQVHLVNTTDRKGYSDEKVWKDSSGEYYEYIEYTKDHASYQRTRKW